LSFVQGRSASAGHLRAGVGEDGFRALAAEALDTGGADAATAAFR
jgi:hypothetical protein